MNPTIIRQDVRTVRAGACFVLNGTIREVVSARPSRCFAVNGIPVPGVEFVHKDPYYPGVAYLQMPEGSQLAVVVL
jgi:hypothetical protein